ncbi:hypothetical protein [Sorangium sp. So ce117]|uniref:hypothetical protein n=1 Tax=Sorangium sp. So ce117 TaxID=3133277 RepID=UPI003F632C6A
MTPPIWVGSIAALLGGEARRSEIAHDLAPLVEREILVRRRESRFSGEEELAFRHALLREGAYATLTEGDRTLGHKLAGAWLPGVRWGRPATGVGVEADSNSPRGDQPSEQSILQA